MKVVNNLFWMDEPRPEWHDPELQPRVDEEVQPGGRALGRSYRVPSPESRRNNAGFGKGRVIA